MSEQLSNCLVCNATDFSSYLDCRDFTVSQEVFHLVKCTSCGFVFTNPRPTMQESGAYYKSEAYISHTNSSKGLLNKAYQFARKSAIKNKLKIVEANSSLLKSILDYGCGTGEFLAAAKASGYIAAGLELDEDARNLARKNHQLNVSDPVELQKFSDGQFGVITLWHVLEHVHLLNETVQHFHRCLASDGTLIIAVPNCDSFDANHYKEFWAAYDVPRHLYHFTPASIQQLMTKNGFRLQTSIPLFFDPFYISLLSEKYKNGWSNPLKAAWIGLRTTLAGRKNISANSSIIYVFKKQK